jgi:hypothetical protein
MIVVEFYGGKYASLPPGNLYTCQHQLIETQNSAVSILSPGKIILGLCWETIGSFRDVGCR